MGRLLALGNQRCGATACVGDHIARIGALVEQFAVDFDCGTKRCEAWQYTSGAKFGNWLGSGLVTSKEHCKPFYENNAQSNHYMWVQDDPWVEGKETFTETTVFNKNLGCCIAECTVG